MGVESDYVLVVELIPGVFIRLLYRRSEAVIKLPRVTYALCQWCVRVISLCYPEDHKVAASGRPGLSLLLIYLH